MASARFEAPTVSAIQGDASGVHPTSGSSYAHSAFVPVEHFLFSTSRNCPFVLSPTYLDRTTLFDLKPNQVLCYSVSLIYLHTVRAIRSPSEVRRNALGTLAGPT